MLLFYSGLDRGPSGCWVRMRRVQRCSSVNQPSKVLQTAEDKFPLPIVGIDNTNHLCKKERCEKPSDEARLADLITGYIGATVTKTKVSK